MFKLTVAILPTCSKIRREGLLDDENWEVGEFGRGEEKHIIRNWSALVGQFSKCDVYLGCWVVGIACNQPRPMRICSPHLRRSQFSSVSQLCLTLCDPMGCSMPGLLVYHQLLALAQTHVHRVSDDIQPFHLLLSPSPPAFNLCQHQSLFQWVSSSLRWTKHWSLSFSISASNEYSVLISFRIDWLDLFAVQVTLESLLSPQFKSINYLPWKDKELDS